jgi:hypothetical protein
MIWRANGKSRRGPRRAGTAGAARWDVLEREQAGIKQFDPERGALVRHGRDVELQLDLVDVGADIHRADIDLHVHLRLRLPLVDCGRGWILERKILDVLGDDADLGRVAGTRVEIDRCAVVTLFIGHIV